MNRISYSKNGLAQSLQCLNAAAVQAAAFIKQCASRDQLFTCCTQVPAAASQIVPGEQDWA